MGTWCKSEEKEDGFQGGNRVFDPLTNVRGLDREKKILDSCFCRNDQRTVEWYIGTWWKSERKEDGFPPARE